MQFHMFMSIVPYSETILFLYLKTLHPDQRSVTNTDFEMPGISQMDLNSQQSDMMVQSQPGFNADTINTLIISILH